MQWAPDFQCWPLDPSYGAGYSFGAIWWILALCLKRKDFKLLFDWKVKDRGSFETTLLVGNYFIVSTRESDEEMLAMNVSILPFS